MYSLYRRHTPKCPHKAKGRGWKRCKCPIWVDGVENGLDRRESLKTTAWEDAELKLSDLRKNVVRETAKTVVDACSVFSSDLQVRVQPETVRKHRAILRAFQDFCKDRGRVYLKQVTFEDVIAFRASWKDAPISAAKKLERFKTFYRFCARARWCEDVTAGLKSPAVKPVPTLPYTQEQFARVIEAAGRIREKHKVDGVTVDRLRALILVLRYTGLRVQDAVKLGPDKVQQGRVFLYAQKTGEPVWVPIPKVLNEALDRCELRSPDRYFWTGEGTPETACGNWRRSLRRVFKLAKIADAHPHRFRDTFAVEMLAAGKSIESVSVLLGHSSIRTTEKHYSPWVRTRQEKLERDVRDTWGQDEFLKLHESTKSVQGVN